MESELGGAMGGDVLAKNKNYKVYSGADKASPEKVYFDELKRVSKNQIIFGANYMTTKNKRWFFLLACMG